MEITVNHSKRLPDAVASLTLVICLAACSQQAPESDKAAAGGEGAAPSPIAARQAEFKRIGAANKAIGDQLKEAAPSAEIAGSGQGDGPARSRWIKLWDWPVRIAHWAFVILLPALWWTSENDQMSLHRWLGYGMLGLIVFRLYWGLAGSSPARFASFLKGPGTVAVYVRALFANKAESRAGHSPLGALSVVALLGLLLTQVMLGLFAQDVDGLEAGPLARHVSYGAAEAARYWHGAVFDGLLWLVGLHLAAISFYLLVKRDNLIGPMLTGWKKVSAETQLPRFAPFWRLIAGILLGCATAGWVSLGAPLPGWVS